MHLQSSEVRVTFDPGADHLVDRRLGGYFMDLMHVAYTKWGVTSVNISSTTNHPTNKARSRHSKRMAFDINYINGIHVTNNPNSPIYSIEDGLIYSVIMDDSLNAAQWLEAYGPTFQSRWVNGVSTEWPSVGPQHQNHIHISLDGN